MPQTVITSDVVFEWIRHIPDPEIPVINIDELGVLRDITVNEAGVTVDISPTYSGCPAMKQIEDDIVSIIKSHGIQKVKINLVYSPPWSTKLIKAEAREKLRAYGIAPPDEDTEDKNELLGKKKSIACPRCNSRNTKMISQFGSTACKALYQCQDCLEAFDYFKCI
jgi:ring-1,2-phenylacetyl-CoA epoxidase subunit PaaD